MRAAFLLALAACGRVDFDPVSDSLPTGHDEDGDGVPDAFDDCPHVPGAQRDSDGDGVGDACDYSAAPDEYIAVFATMQPDNQPFTASGSWMQSADAMHFDGVDTYAQLQLAIDVRSVRVAVGFDIHQVLGGNIQHQMSLSVNADPEAPHLFVELNEVPGLSNAAITSYDSGNYVIAQGQTLANGFHPGTGVIQTTQLASTSVSLHAGWTGELYDLDQPTATYTNATTVVLGVNNLDVDIRYLCVIATR